MFVQLMIFVDPDLLNCCLVPISPRFWLFLIFNVQACHAKHYSYPFLEALSATGNTGNEVLNASQSLSLSQSRRITRDPRQISYIKTVESRARFP